MGFSLGLGLLWGGDVPELLHHTHRVIVVPALHYLALGDPLDRDTRYLHPVTCGGTHLLSLTLVGATSPPAANHLVSFCYLVFYGAGEVRKSTAEASSELPGALYTIYVFWHGGVVADKVGGIDLLCDI